MGETGNSSYIYRRSWRESLRSWYIDSEADVARSSLAHNSAPIFGKQYDIKPLAFRSVIRNHFPFNHKVQDSLDFMVDEDDGGSAEF